MCMFLIFYTGEIETGCNGMLNVKKASNIIFILVKCSLLTSSCKCPHLFHLVYAPIPVDPLYWWFPLAWQFCWIGSLGSSMDLPPLASAQMGSFLLNTLQSNRSKSISLAPFGFGLVCFCFINYGVLLTHNNQTSAKK